MTLSHAKTVTINRSTEVIDNLLKDVKLITKQAKESPVAELELKLQQTFAQVERECMAQLLVQYDWDYPGFKSQGKNYRKASRNYMRKR